jgi:hypothetical protein
MSYEELLVEVRRLLRESLEARYRGELHVGKVRAQAYADGYMRALGDAGLLSRQELLQLVVDCRTQTAGAATEERIAAAG